MKILKRITKIVKFLIVMILVSVKLADENPDIGFHNLLNS